MKKSILVVALATACSTQHGDAGATGPGVIAIDGSSTVFPITEAVAESWQAENPGQRVTIGVSGTGGGMKKFCAGEVAMTGASRPIKGKERELCAEKGIGFLELAVAYDGIAVVTHKENDWVDNISVAELKAMWSPEAQGQVSTWNNVNPEYPEQPLRLFGPGIDSGTYDYFTKAIVGEEHSSRGDFTSSEDDNVLVTGVAGDKGGLGFFGLAYYMENRDKLKLLGVYDGENAPVKPNLKTVADGSYQPLSRPLFLYVSTQAAERPEVVEFVTYFLGDTGAGLAGEVGYIPLPSATRGKVQARFDKGTTGSLFENGSMVGATLDEML